MQASQEEVDPGCDGEGGRRSPSEASGLQSKEAKKIHKKMNQIRKLQDLQAGGQELDPAQLRKIATLKELESQLLKIEL